MLTSINSIHKTSNKKVIIIQIIFGIFIFYFIFHPITMVLYWFEFKNEPITLASFFEVLKHRTMHSFSSKMVNMSIVFIGMGGLIGAVFGVYKVKNKKLIKHLGLLKKDMLNIINQGENQFLEFKSSLRYDYHQQILNTELEMVIAKTLVGFMNAKGGKLIIGINDNGEILGLVNDFKTLKQKNIDGFEQKIYQIISNFIGKEYCPYTSVYFRVIEEIYICVLDIQKTMHPAYLINGTETIFYLRTGNTTRPLSVKEAVHFINMEN